MLQYAQKLSNAEVPESIRQSILAERSRQTATGVKVHFTHQRNRICTSITCDFTTQGVLADYRAAQALAEAESQAVAQHRQQVLTRMVEGAKVQHVEQVKSPVCVLLC